MKTRNGFVSNSSSSSFCIFGTSLEISEFHSEIFDKFGKDRLVAIYNTHEAEIRRLHPESVEYHQDIAVADFDTFEEKGSLPEYLETILYEIEPNVTIVYHNDADMVYIGREWSSVKDHETGAEFKDSVGLIINNILPNTKLTGIHTMDVEIYN